MSIMSDSGNRTDRRAVLGTAGALLTGLAGCMTFNAGSDGQATSESTRTNQTSSQAQSVVHASTETTEFGINLEDNPLMGSPDAPVDLYYWSDYQCPFCNRFEQNTFPKLLEAYIKPGKVRLAILEYVTIGDASKTAAHMSKCVWRQVKEDDPDAFRRWHASIFDAQKKPNSGWAKKQNLLDITEGVAGVDADAVASCLQENEQSLAASVSEDKTAGNDNGVNVTPTFIFHNPDSSDSPATVQGAQPFERFEATIETVMK